MRRRFRAAGLALLAGLLVSLLALPSAAFDKRDREHIRRDRVATLIRKLASQEAATRLRCAQLLAEVGDESAFGPLERALGDSETPVRVAAIDALARLHAAAEFEIFVGLLDDPELAVQEAAAVALGRLGDPKAVEPLVAKLPKTPALWLEVAEALGRLGEKKTAQTIYKIALAVTDLGERARAAGALGKLAPAAAFELLDALYKSKEAGASPALRAEVLAAAGEMNKPEGAAWLAEKIRRIPVAGDPGEEDALRDALASALGRFTDRALFLSVLAELRQETDARRLSRNLAVWLLGVGRARLATMEEEALRYLDDPESEVKQAAVTCLGDIRSAAAVPRLLLLMDSPDIELSTPAFGALGQIGDFSTVGAIAARLQSAADPRVRYAAAAALYAIRSDEVVEPLIVAMKGAREWFLLELAGMLRELTGKDHGKDAQAWSDWWDKAKAAFKVHYEEDNLDFRATVYYYGIEITSDRIAFCLDISGSMEDPDTSDLGVIYTDAPGQKARRRRKKIEVAKEELIKTIKALKPTTRFALWSYSFDPKAWKKELVLATDAVKAEAIAYVEKLATGGGTNIFDTLDRCFAQAGPGVTDPKVEMKVDTIFLLSDGSPNRGRFPEPRQILAKIREMNRLGRMRIHTIGVGDEQNVVFMRRLAAQNGGRYVRK